MAHEERLIEDDVASGDEFRRLQAQVDRHVGDVLPTPRGVLEDRHVGVALLEIAEVIALLRMVQRLHPLRQPAAVGALQRAHCIRREMRGPDPRLDPLERLGQGCLPQHGEDQQQQQAARCEAQADPGGNCLRRSSNHRVLLLVAA